MKRYENILTISKVDGEWGFGVRATVQELTLEDMNKFRETIIVAIGTMEDMWKRRPTTVEPQSLFCHKCGGEVGHRINCPDGIAFSKP